MNDGPGLACEPFHCINVRSIVHCADESDDWGVGGCRSNESIRQVDSIGHNMDSWVGDGRIEDFPFPLANYQSRIEPIQTGPFEFAQPASLTSIDRSQRTSGTIGIVEPLLTVQIAQIKDTSTGGHPQGVRGHA